MGLADRLKDAGRKPEPFPEAEPSADYLRYLQRQSLYKKMDGFALKCIERDVNKKQDELHKELLPLLDMLEAKAQLQVLSTYLEGTGIVGSPTFLSISTPSVAELAYRDRKQRESWREDIRGIVSGDIDPLTYLRQSRDIANKNTDLFQVDGRLRLELLQRYNETVPTHRKVERSDFDGHYMAWEQDGYIIEQRAIGIFVFVGLDRISTVAMGTELFFDSPGNAPCFTTPFTPKEIWEGTPFMTSREGRQVLEDQLFKLATDPWLRSHRRKTS